MSRRAIKRYEEALEAEKFENPTGSPVKGEAGNESDEHHEAPRAPQSLFALLAEDEDDESEDEDGAAQGDYQGTIENSGKDAADAVQHDEEVSETTEDLEVEQPEQTKKKKKKKRRKGTKKNESQLDRENDPDWIALNESIEPSESKEGDTAGWIPSSYFAKDDGEDVRQEAKSIMTIIEGMVLSDQDNVHDSETPADKALHVEARLLNADSELKKLFGAKVVESERRGEEAAQNARRRGRPSGRPHTRRRVTLVSPRETWFGHAPGLTMVVDSEASKDAAGGIRYFRYKHEASYARVQDDYRTLVGAHDPNLLVELSSRHPYHVDTLLQLAELYRQMGELDRAAEQVERSLYVLETAWNLSFKPYDGSCRLSFDVLENRSLYVALFRYSQLLTRRGLHRTALEISKLLLNFDPENDPMGMLMLADSYALLSGEYEWIKNMRESYKYIPIRYFPNFAASAGVAAEAVRLGITGMSNRGGGGKGKKSSKGQPANRSNTEGSDEADELLVDALLTFPMLLKPLLSAIQDNSSVWTESRLFDEAWYGVGYEDYGVLLRISRVYAERSKLLWNSTVNKDMLIRCARKAGELDTAAGMGMDPTTGRSTSAFVSDAEKHVRVARCRALRAEAGEWLRGSGLYEKVQIADFTDSTTNLPAELLAGDGADRAVGAAPPREVTMAQGALEFLQSLLPWRDASDARDE